MIFEIPMLCANISDGPLSEVLYDPSAPELSVAVMGTELLENGDLYENALVIGFEPAAVIFKNIETSEAVKCPLQENPAAEPRLRQWAVHLFISKQMKAIHEAQTGYWHKFGKAYAPDLETLVRQGFLKGFEDGRKQGYFFEIAELSQTKGTSMFPKEASFMALASPQENSAGELFFSVNRLGEVRYGVTRVEAPWGPVWDYNEHWAGPSQQIIRQI